MLSTETVIECCALLFALLLMVAAPRSARVMQVTLMRWCGRLSARPGWCIAVLGIGTALVAAAHAHFVLWPEPSIHDEFAYLLGAETFAGGELTRPTHPFWQHFETYHILQVPSYAPKYPPGQSLSLALAQVLTGEVRVGLWLQAGALIASVAWMLFGWLPRRWALFGSVLIALQLGIIGPGVQTFFGGNLTAVGGALMLGAVARLRVRGTVSAAVWLGIGLGLMALTRPYEGIAAGIPTALYLVYLLAKTQGAERAGFAARVFVPPALVLLVVGSGIALHNRAVTGSALKLPYAAYDEQYSIFPPFAWQPKAPTPTYRYPKHEEFNLGFQSGDRYIWQSPLGYVKLVLRRTWLVLEGLFGKLLLVPLLLPVIVAGWGHLPRRSRLVLPGAIVACVGVALMATTYTAPHYASPALGALALFTVAGWRRLTTASSANRARGAALCLGILLGLGVVTAKRGATTWFDGLRYLGKIRAQVRDKLRAEPGADLVFVRALPDMSVHQEFVFNHADIDASPIVWAHELDPEADAALMEYYKGRHVWRLTSGRLMSGSWDLEKITPGDPKGGDGLTRASW